MWPGAEVNVDAGHRRDAVNVCQSRTTTRPSLMRSPFDRPVYISWTNQSNNSLGKMNPNKQKILGLIAPGLFVVAIRRKVIPKIGTRSAHPLTDGR